jgi:sulfur-carrier protein
VIQVRYYAGARAATGLAEEKLDAADVAALRTCLAERHGPRAATVLAACSLLVDGVAATGPATAIPAGATVEVLPPFAGG